MQLRKAGLVAALSAGAAHDTDDVEPVEVADSDEPPERVRVLRRCRVRVDDGGRLVRLAANDVFGPPMSAILWRSPDAREHIEAVV